MKISIIHNIHINNDLLLLPDKEAKVKAFLKREVVHRKKEIYSSIQTTIQNQMTAGYERKKAFKAIHTKFTKHTGVPVAQW